MTRSKEPATRVEIEGNVEGKTKDKRTALKKLIEQGDVAECGAGAKGGVPFRYFVPPTEKETFVDSCSSHIEGTREQESKKSPQTPINTGDILVPAERGKVADQGTGIQGEENENIGGLGLPPAVRKPIPQLGGNTPAPDLYPSGAQAQTAFGSNGREPKATAATTERDYLFDAAVAPCRQTAQASVST